MKNKFSSPRKDFVNIVLVKNAVRFALTAAVFVTSCLAHGQSPSEREQLLKKADPALVRSLTAGTPQNAFVLLDLSSERATVKGKYDALRSQNIHSGASAAYNNLIQEQAKDLRAAEINWYGKVKTEIFSSDKHPRINIVHDLVGTSVTLVRIPDLDALIDLLGEPRVQNVSLPPLPPKRQGLTDLQRLRDDVR